jgi:hypothetical protein
MKRSSRIWGWWMTGFVVVIGMITVASRTLRGKSNSVIVTGTPAVFIGLLFLALGLYFTFLMVCRTGDQVAPNSNKKSVWKRSRTRR